MLEIENTLLTGAITVNADVDGNVVLVQNRQEIKLTSSQISKLQEYLNVNNGSADKEDRDYDAVEFQNAWLSVWCRSN